MCVFPERDIARVMNLVFDSPVAAIVIQQPLSIGLVSRQIRDAVNDLSRRFQLARHAVAKFADAGHAKDLLHAGPAELPQYVIERRGGLNGSCFATSMAFIMRRMLLPFGSPLLGLIGGKRPRRGRRIHWKSWTQASADSLWR